LAGRLRTVRRAEARHSDDYYLQWPAELVRRIPEALARARQKLASQIDQVRFAQFLLFRQGERLKDMPTPEACA
jgi:4-alpha-glucanotransferase